jgi:hypothetical protein
MASGTGVGTALTLEPGQPTVLALPLDHASVEPLRVRLALDDGRAVERELVPRLLPAGTALVAVVGSADVPPWAVTGAGAMPVYQDPASLPRLGRAYDSVDRLLISDAALRALDPEQRQALAAFLGRCGRVQLQPASTALAALRAVAGCGGRYVGEAPAGGTAAGPEALPGAPALRRLLGESADASRPLLVLLLGYPLLLVVLARSAAGPLALLSAPPAVALLALAGWAATGPQAQSVSWAEMDSGDPVARYAGLLQWTGSGRGRHLLALRPDWRPDAAGAPRHIELAPDGSARLALETRLLSRGELRFEGLAPAPAVTVRELEQEVQVSNGGPGPTPPGTLAWRGGSYAVPPLAPGQSWRTPPEPGGWDPGAVQELLRRRALRGPALLLLPLRLAEPAAEPGWLLVRSVRDA